MIATVTLPARTSRGGRQLPMFEPHARGGCLEWGFCEPTEVADA